MNIDDITYLGSYQKFEIRERVVESPPARVHSDLDSLHSLLHDANILLDGPPELRVGRDY